MGRDASILSDFMLYRHSIPPAILRNAGGLCRQGQLSARAGTEASSGVLGDRSGLKVASVGKELDGGLGGPWTGMCSVLATVPLPTGVACLVTASARFSANVA